MRPPSTAQVIPGALVNIVLKADQPTGRTVSGKIQDVLTRGNHPRGIKVRLVDGRVGRVQSMLSPSSSSTPATGNSTATASASTSATSNGLVETDGLDGSGGDWGSGSGFGGGGDFSGHSRGRGRGRGRGRDGGGGRGPRGRRNDYDDGAGGGYPPEQQALGLDAYIKPARNQRRGGGRGGGAGSMSRTTAGGGSNSDEVSGVRQETAGELSVCPVCGDFEGDEAAVAHHVAGHFGD